MLASLIIALLGAFVVQAWMLFAGVIFGQWAEPMPVLLASVIAGAIAGAIEWWFQRK